MKVVWARNALQHLTDIHEYISRDSQRYAMRVMDRITARSKRIGQYPQSGQVVTEYEHPAVREVIEGAYRVIYRIEEHRVVVLAVIHAARLLSKNLPETEV